MAENRKPVKGRADFTRSLNNYARYSGMAFQMIFIIALGVFGGVKLDVHFGCKPVLTLVCSFAGLFVAFYVVIKDALRSGQNENGKKNTH